MEPRRITIKQRIAQLNEFIQDCREFEDARNLTEYLTERAQLQSELERDGDKWWN